MKATLKEAKMVDGRLKLHIDVDAPGAIDVKVFCATGEGGGVDPTCSPGQGSSSGQAEKIQKQWASWDKDRDFYKRVEAEHRERWEKIRKSFIHGTKSRISRATTKYKELGKRRDEIQEEFEKLDKERWDAIHARHRILDENPDNLQPSVQKLVADHLQEEADALGKRLEPMADELDKITAAQSDLWKGDIMHKALHAAIKQNSKDVPKVAILDKELVSMERSEPLTPELQQKVDTVEKWLHGKVHKDAVVSSYDIDDTWKVAARQKPADMEQRAHAFYGEIALSQRSEETTIVHELGHVVEFKAPEAARGFLTERIGTEAPKQLKSLYPDSDYKEHEWGAKDDFTKAFEGGESRAYYTGKHYDDGFTEITSMGLEEMYRNPLHFAENDPEYFRFMVGTLDGTWRQQSILEKRPK